MYQCIRARKSKHRYLVQTQLKDSKTVLTDGSTRAISSTARHDAVKFRPTPPYSMGASIPIIP